MFLNVSMRISTIRVGLAFRCMCTSCIDSSRPRICPVLHEFTLVSASGNLTSLSGTYLMFTSYCFMWSCIRADLGGAAKRCLVKMDSSGSWSVCTSKCSPNTYWWNRSSANTIPSIPRSMLEYRLSVPVSD